MDKLANMQAFALVGQTGSFAETARKLGVTNSVVSKRIKDLEAHLHVQLFIRSTRKVRLTENGRSYFNYVVKLLEEIAEVESQLQQHQEQPTGEIRLAAPLSFGTQFLGAALSHFLNEYSEVSIKSYLSDRRVDIIEEGYDLAIRTGPLPDSNLIAKKLATFQRVVCASPEYFAHKGKPQSPSDLKEHNCLSYLNVAEGRAWPFMAKGKSVWQAVSGRFQSDNGDLLHEAALSNCGITLLPTFIVGKSLQQGTLETALEHYQEEDFHLYAVYQQTRHLSVKVRLLIDHLAETFSGLSS